MLSLSSVLQHCNQSDHITKLSDTLNVIFTVLFTIEMIVKLIAFKAKVVQTPLRKKNVPQTEFLPERVCLYSWILSAGLLWRPLERVWFPYCGREHRRRRPQSGGCKYKSKNIYNNVYARQNICWYIKHNSYLTKYQQCLYILLVFTHLHIIYTNQTDMIQDGQMSLSVLRLFSFSVCLSELYTYAMYLSII